MTREEFLNAALEWRNIQNPCPSCGGSGNKTYGSTATWRGGIGGQSLTVAICNQCWGSGDKDKPWTNLKKLDLR